MAEMKDGCVQPARGPILPAAHSAPTAEDSTSKEVISVRAQVGKEAPDFESTAFVNGKGFEPIKLSDYRGRWIVLCFYPGDFTFV